MVPEVVEAEVQQFAVRTWELFKTGSAEGVFEAVTNIPLWCFDSFPWSLNIKDKIIGLGVEPISAVFSFKSFLRCAVSSECIGT
jgi:hypothetical protein